MKTRERERRSSVYLFLGCLLLLTLLAAALRLHRLNGQSLWYDEGFSVYLARMDLSEITSRTAEDIQPPLYYYLLHGWIRLFGESETTLRALSLIFGVLAVPLSYGVAVQLFRSRLAGLLTALLLGISPLHIWYSQEVRMYTLLVLLTLLASYLLLLIAARASRARSGGRRVPAGEVALWLAYTAVAIAAVYTHYFAFFVLAFHGVYVLLASGINRFRPARLIFGGILSGVVTIAVYLPWLPHLLKRYGTDASYLPGHLKLNEVFVDVAVFFGGGESVSEQTGLRLAAGLGLILIVCLLALVVHGASRRYGRLAGAKRHTAGVHPVPFLLLYLLLPPALILLLSYNAPKFNARYVMISHPAVLLLLGGGLAALWQRTSSAFSTLMRRALVGVALLGLLTSAVYADCRAYGNPNFSRADFRAVAHHIREQMQPDEVVILCSGHMFPVFDFYAPGVERYLLPDSPTLDTTRTLDYSIGVDLNRWLADKGGLWLVLWQDEVVDPVGYLPALLAEVGDEVPVGRTFAQVRVRHYRLPAGSRFPEGPEIHHPTRINFGDRLWLLGYNQSGLQQVTLFWQAVRPLEEDYLVSIVLRDTNNQVWGQWDGRPTAYLYPTTRWRVGQVVFGRYDLVPAAGTPPGDYGIDVGVYTEQDPVGLDILDAAGAPQGKRAMLGAVRLSVPAVGPDAIDVPNEREASMGGGLGLIGWDINRFEAQPGDRLLLTLAWVVRDPPQADYQVRLLVTDAAGTVLDAGSFPPTSAWHPTSIWQAGQAWLGHIPFRLPIQAQVGEARLAVQLVDAWGTDLGPVADLTAVEVLPTARTFVRPEPQVRRDAVFEDRIALLGADLAPVPARRGEVLQVTLHWQALADMDIPYTVFVHLLGLEGQVVTGHDGQPMGGERPTTSWVPGEYLSDVHEVPIPSGLAAGDYVVEVGWYDSGAPGMPRLAILGSEGRAEADRVIFGPVQVR